MQNLFVLNAFIYVPNEFDRVGAPARNARGRNISIDG